MKRYTLLRFSHAFRSGGGVESYLTDLDEALLNRFDLKVIRVFIDKQSDVPALHRTIYRRGELVEIGVRAKMSISSSGGGRVAIGSRLKRWLKRVVVGSPFFPVLYHSGLFRFVERQSIAKHRPVVIEKVEETIKQIVDENAVDLFVLHYLGSSDSAEVIKVASEMRIPTVFINHFSNELFYDFEVRKQLIGCDAVAGVTDYGVPRYLRNQFVNVSDGIDLSFFSLSVIASAGFDNKIPIVLYPARITPVKGQLDLLRAIRLLRDRGVEVRAALAGRMDSEQYFAEIQRYIEKYGLSARVDFLGEMSRAKLREWYSASTLLAFPTYHEEGTPRILMECQAAGLPPITYRSGGTPGTIVDGVTGLLINKGDIVGLSNAIERIVTDSIERQRLSSNAQNHALRNYGLESLAKRHLALYSSVIRGADRSQPSKPGTYSKDLDWRRT